jgi:hypothetical protein
MSCPHEKLMLVGIPGPATKLVCSECRLSDASVVDALYSRWRASEAALARAREALRGLLDYADHAVIRAAREALGETEKAP